MPLGDVVLSRSNDEHVSPLMVGVVQGSPDADGHVAVVVPSFSEGHATDALPVAPQGGSLPSDGDLCLVASDEEGQLWVVSWIGTYISWGAKGDLLVGSGLRTAGVLPVGANGRVLVADSTSLLGVKWDVKTPPIASDTLWDVKGDLAAATGPDAAARLPVGTDGRVLTADSSTGTGLVWTDKNRIATDPLWTSKGEIAAGTGASTGTRLSPAANGNVLATDSSTTTGLAWVPKPTVAADGVWDAKGDLVVGTGPDAAVRLAVGVDGRRLIADSTQPTGLNWAPPNTVASDLLWNAKGDLALATGPDAATRLGVGADGSVLVADAAQTVGARWGMSAGLERPRHLVITTVRLPGSVITAGGFYVFQPQGVVTTELTAGDNPFMVYLDPADEAAVGGTARLRFKCAFGVNNTAPGTTFTAGLYPTSGFGGASGVFNPSSGARVTGSGCASGALAANAKGTPVNSGDFAYPTAGWYVLGVDAAGAMAAASEVRIAARLEVHYV